MSKYNIVLAEAFSKILEWNPKDILRFMLGFAQHSRLDPDNVAVVPFVNIPKEPPKTTLVKDFGHLFGGNGECRENDLVSYEQVVNRIMVTFPIIYRIQMSNCTIAGSFPLLYCESTNRKDHRSVHGPNDVDFFLFSNEEDNSNTSTATESISKRSAQDIALDCYTNTLQEINTAIFGHQRVTENDSFGKTFTVRNENCTTIYCSEIITMQVIHRLFKSRQAVVVGFDQIISKVFYDPNGFDSTETRDINFNASENLRTKGGMIYFTLDAALAVYFGINPVDWKRESPTHGQRYMKYSLYGYYPIFPGLPFSLVKEMHDAKRSEQRKNTNIPKLGIRNENGNIYIFSNGCYYTSMYMLPGICLLLTESKGIYKITLDGNIYMRYINNREFIKAKEWVTINDISKYKPNNSDYNGDLKDRSKRLFEYRSLTRIIKDKDLHAVCADGILDITNNFERLDIKRILSRLDSEECILFYFGERLGEEYYRIKTEHEKIAKRFPIPVSKLKRLNEIIVRTEAILNERSEELKEVYNKKLEHLQKIIFNACNPGSQYTASFKPMIRAHPRDYWGSHYQPFSTAFFHREKLTLLCIRKRKGNLLSEFSMDLMRYLFRMIDELFIKALLNCDHGWINSSAFEITRPDRKEILNRYEPFPWMTVSPVYLGRE